MNQPMNRRLLYRLMNIPLDLALESHEILSREGEISGVSLEKTPFAHGEISRIQVLNEQGAAAIGKPQGAYVTLESEALRIMDREAHASLVSALRDILDHMLALPENATVLCCGLGNPMAISDALGPMVANRLLATRGVFETAPEICTGLRDVSVISPGVSGATGIETAEILEALIDKTHPDILICIDALSASSLSRLNATIQLSDTGIYPGSGVGNRRKSISRQTVGIPVLALGVPTVVSAGIIAHQAMEALIDHLSRQRMPEGRHEIRPQEVQSIIEGVLEPFGGQLTVTPKEVDEQIRNLAHIIASAITLALHPGIQPEDAALYMH
jgi:spore protease